jgi:hypothetical protein
LGDILGDFFTNSSGHPGDEIGQFFACWAIVFFGQFFYFGEAFKFWSNFFLRKKLRINFDKHGLDYTLGDSCTSSLDGWKVFPQVSVNWAT